MGTSWAKTCGENGPEILKPFGDQDHYMTDLKVMGLCNVVPDSDNGNYYFHDVNIVNGGELKFHDDFDIDFYAESIVVEDQGKLTAVSTQKGFLPQRRRLDDVLPYQKKLTIHLWGKPEHAGIECASKEDETHGPCGIPLTVWESNPTMADHMEHDQGPPSVKNAACKTDSKYMDGKDCFYKYEVQEKQDRDAKRKAYFGHKVLAVSYGGSLQLFGSKGVSYISEQGVCSPNTPGNECNPAFTGKSWTRLTSLSADRTTIKVSSAVDWAENDVIVITPTDYLPSHLEERTITKVDVKTGELTLNKALEWDHNSKTYPLAGVPAEIGPKDDPNILDIKRAVDTRAAVALLSRNIRVVSEGGTPAEKFPDTGYYYGGHTMVRQGFASYRVQGVEFYLLGQGGQKGRYSVHFHMLRKVPQAQQNDKGPLNFLKDSSIHDSMTRWVTVHATEGLYIARNVGEKSIGHGFYLEDATETNNKFYANIGIFARAAINDPDHNPHHAPGILASNQANNPPFAPADYMPYRSDYNHPTVFWITNGWNDFEYNFAAGAATCGACYWWLPAGNSGPSQYEYWEGYASQQIVKENLQNNYDRAGLSPLHKFVGNACVAAMNSFQMISTTASCLGVDPPGNADRGLSAVNSTAPNGPDARFLPEQTFQVYYPVLSEQHTPTLCDKADCAGTLANPKCDSVDSFGNCTVTQLDHYTTSFNFAQTNFAAVWLRKGWDLFTNGALTDIQSGGLNFITGGGYTHSDVSVGEWLLARHTVFIGHSQPADQNPYAMDVGPFNEKTKDKIQCGTSDSNHCEYAAGGMSYNLPDYPGQKLLNIYDGPSHQTNNAYFDINVSKLDDCFHTGDCKTSAVPLARNLGVLYNDEKAFCYLPNAAIAWKQPNGFYYPPAFHSANLWFKNVEIRHFVVEPLFTKVKIGETNPFQQNQQAVTDRYCTRSATMFGEFNHIDRQTVLNDDDGTLTGLIGALKIDDGTMTKYLKRPSISINEDPFFRSAPGKNDKPECLSDINILPISADGDVGTARTSPYEWLTTGIFADCALDQCFDPNDQKGHWWIACTNQRCRGVPLYREYLTTAEMSEKGTYLPQIRMMGQSTGQRSTMTMNHGAFYIDITQSCESQGGCPKCAKVKDNRCEVWGPVEYSPSTFIAGHTYYVYFLYTTPTTQQTYDMYIGDMKKEDLNIKAIYVNPIGNYPVFTPTDTRFISVSDKIVNNKKLDGVVSVTLDMSKQGPIFTATTPNFCKPKSYCEARGDSCCKIGLADCNAVENDCSWATHDIDCPVDTKNPDIMHCFGFSFTLPKDPARDVTPPADLFVSFDEIPYFAKDTTFLRGKSISPKDACVYTDVQKQ
jgi:hypothetical protein